MNLKNSPATPSGSRKSSKRNIETASPPKAEEQPPKIVESPKPKVTESAPVSPSVPLVKEEESGSEGLSFIFTSKI